MMISTSDFALLSPSTQEELLALWMTPAPATKPEPVAPSSTESYGDQYKGFSMSDVADLNPAQVKTWMTAASDPTKMGLRVFAERGPIIEAGWLTEAGVTNIAHFQSRTTIRTRTITGNKDAYLLGWDAWDYNDDGSYKAGRYAVTPTTYQSLREYFGIV
jgi:hypothetical protein